MLFYSFTEYMLTQSKLMTSIFFKLKSIDCFLIIIISNAWAVLASIFFQGECIALSLFEHYSYKLKFNLLLFSAIKILFTSNLF